MTKPGAHGFTAHIGRQDDDGVAETAFFIVRQNQVAVFKNAQQEIPHFGVGFFYLIEQNK